jgi:hypothetical protein
MRRESFLAVIAAVFILSCLPATAQELAAAQLVQPADFTKQEQDYYARLTGDDAKNFIITRSYVRLCEQVVERKLPAAQLPDRPAGFTVRYLLPEDPTVTNRALAYQIQAAHGEPPTSLEMTPEQVLKPADLTQEEHDYYVTLTGVDAQHFILTRSYVRLCQQVNASTLAAAELPDKPIGFNPGYLLPGDKEAVDKAISASLAVVMKRILK